MNIKEIEQKIHKINNSKVIKKIRLSYRESNELDEFYIDVWLENISKFLADDRKINTEFDVCKEVAKEIIEFANYSERTYAAALYDFVRYFLINKLNLDYLSDWFKVTEYFDNIAIEVDNAWPKILDVFDDFTLSELEEFLETGFELISHPTCDTLMDIDITENRLLEMRYIISVGLFILYENHNIDDMLMNESFLEQSTENRNDRNYVIEALRQNGLIFKHIETKFQTDEELALIAIEQNSDVVVEEMLPMELIEDGDFIEKVIRIQPLLITYFLGNKDYDILIDKKLLFIAIEEIGVDALWEMDSEIFKDIDIIVAALKSPYGQHIWEAILYDAGAEYSKKIIEAGYNLYGDKVLALNYSSLTNDRQVVESVISIDGHLLYFVNQEFKMDKGIIEKAILNDAHSFRFIPESLKDDRSFVLELASINGNILSKLSNDLKDDKEIVRHAMLQDFDTLEYASDRLRNDKEFIFSVLNENIKLQNENKEIMDSILKDFGDNFERNEESYDNHFAQWDKLYHELAKKYNIGNCGILHGVSDVLKSDKEFVLDILKIDPWSVRSISETLKFDMTVMQIVFISERYLLKYYYSDKTMDRDFAIDAININPEVLEFFDISFRNDFEIMKLAISQKCEFLKLASDELKNNRDIVSLAVSKNGALLELASDELKNNRDVVSLAVTNYPFALGVASNNLKKDEEFLGLFYDYIVGNDPHTLIDYKASLELFILLPENKQKNKKLLLYFTMGIWYYGDFYLNRYKYLINKYYSNDIEFIKECMLKEEYDFSFLTLIDYDSVKGNVDLMIAAIQADIRNDREPIMWGSDDLINNVNFLNKVLAMAPQYLPAIKSNKNIFEDVKMKL